MRRTLTTTLVALLGCAALVLSACGGGGCNPCEQDAPTPRVECTARPELCK